MAGLFYKRPPEATSSESLWVRMGLHLLVGTHNDSGRVYGNSSSHCRGLVSTIMSKMLLLKDLGRRDLPQHVRKRFAEPFFILLGQ